MPERAGNKTMTRKFKVSLTRYPEEFEIEAENSTEAVRLAKEKFRYSVWESEVEEVEEEAGVITANHNSKKEKLAKLLELAKKLEHTDYPSPEREHFIDSSGKKVYLPMDYPETSLEEHNQALVNYYEARDRARANVWNLYCSLNCKDYDDVMSAEEEALEKAEAEEEFDDGELDFTCSQCQEIVNKDYMVKRKGFRLPICTDCANANEHEKHEAQERYGDD